MSRRDFLSLSGVDARLGHDLLHFPLFLHLFAIGLVDGRHWADWRVLCRAAVSAAQFRQVVHRIFIVHRHVDWLGLGTVWIKSEHAGRRQYDEQRPMDGQRDEQRQPLILFFSRLTSHRRFLQPDQNG